LAQRALHFLLELALALRLLAARSVTAPILLRSAQQGPRQASAWAFRAVCAAAG
jgi:hypothetical protein